MELFRVFLLVVVGLSGDPEHGELFEKWGASLASTAETLGVAPERVLLVGDQATKVDVEQAIETIATRSTADDVIFVVLIGHGSFDGRAAKFNLKGPDLGATDFAALLRRMPSRHLVFANTTSSSCPFREALAGPGRTIITATRNGAEQYDTLFPGFFVDAFSSDAADVDKNRRVTVQEAFDYAQREVGLAYEREGLLATEHSVIDDAGKLAQTFALGTAGASELPVDPKLRALHAERRQLEQRVEALKVLKGSMDRARFDTEFEALAISLALKTREIRQAEAAQ
jgi:hypothetical protein